MTRRRNRRADPNAPEALAATLPDELRSFEAWCYPNGLHDYMAALSRFLPDGQRLTPVMNHAGLSAAGWFRDALSQPVR
jgi:hypothetical protein